MSHFADVIIPLSLERLFTYSVSDQQSGELQVGMRVAVPFGKQKFYVGIVVRQHSEAPKLYDAKPIEFILDKTPIVTKNQLMLWKWIADYYMCTIGEVCKAALPNALLLKSETRIGLSEKSHDYNKVNLDDKAHLILEALRCQSSLNIGQIQEILGIKTVLPVIHRMLDENLIDLYETMTDKYKPKYVKHIRLADKYTSDKAMEALMNELGRAKKQYRLLMSYLAHEAKNKKLLIKSKTLIQYADVNTAVLQSLVKKGVFEEHLIKEDRIALSHTKASDKLILSSAQQTAFKSILKAWKTHRVVLLKGVTASGKTEVYKSVIDSYLQTEGQILYLVPEIALTTQLIDRLHGYFGDKLCVYHSKFNPNERVEVWNNVLENSPKAKIIVGTRSSVWLPFGDLRCVIVDEEHEPCYKQSDPAPRFHARDTMIYLAHLFGDRVRVLLGSATPSIESFYNVKRDKYALVQLDERHGDSTAPHIEIIDMRDASRRKKVKGYFSKTLLEAIDETVKRGEQVMIYQNRRGYSPLLECHTCGHVPKCLHCDVTLTYHKIQGELRCHYCGYRLSFEVNKCFACGNSDMHSLGYGTEQIESQLNDLLPDILTLRLDSDTTKSKYGFGKIILSFERGEAQVLIGTQMIIKGLDFSKVSLVAVMSADSLLGFQDFRAHEQAYQKLIQVSGRSGRREVQGRVLIQTYKPGHRIIKRVVNGDYEGMYAEETYQRDQFHYPPWYSLIRIIIKGRDFNRTNEAADWFSQSLKRYLNDNILGPEYPSVSKVKNYYIKHIFIKIPPDKSPSAVKRILRKLQDQYRSIGQYRNIRLIMDIDCY